MKSILDKYKIPLISTGILLSIIVSVPIINSNFSKEDVSKKQIDLQAASILEVEENEQSKIENNELLVEELVEENNEMLVEVEENVNEKSSKDSRDSSVESSVDLKPENTQSSAKIKTEASSTQIKEDTKTAQITQTNTNSSAPITEEKYTVKKGDTLFLISQRSSVSTSHLKELNNLSSDVIYENQTLKIKGTVSNSTSQVASRGSDRSENLYWLSRIIHSEAQGESYEGKVAVGNVIMNRVSSGLFPNTIKGVVFDKQDGYTQFSPVIDGTIYNNPGADSIKAATDVLNGARPVGNALYFLNPRKSTNFWIVQNRKYMMTIGLHDFYY